MPDKTPFPQGTAPNFQGCVGLHTHTNRTLTCTTSGRLSPVSTGGVRTNSDPSASSISLPLLLRTVMYCGCCAIGLPL